MAWRFGPAPAAFAPGTGTGVRHRAREHAVSAFELDAVDYHQTRAPATPATSAGQCSACAAQWAHALATVVQAPASPLCPPEAPAHEAEAPCIQERGRTERVPLTELLYIKATKIPHRAHAAARTYIPDGALNDLQARYSSQLLRIHRNAWSPATPCARWKNTTTSSQAAPRPTPGPCACTAAPSC